MGGSQSFPRTPLSKDKIVIVTGGNTGIGYETSKWIAMLGATVILACRSEQRANDAIQRMKEEFQAERKKLEILTDTLAVEFMKVDLSSLNSVMNFIQEFKSSGRNLHCLICNAGIGFFPQSITEDGHEAIFQVNYLSQFLITAHFLPIMLNSGPDCRIVLVSSIAHSWPNYTPDKIQGTEYSKDDFPGFTYYGLSKLYLVMQMFSMNRRLKDTNVTVSSLHPGAVASEFSRSFEDRCCFYCLYRCCLIHFYKNNFQGAETSINAALNPKLANARDIYFADCKPTTPSREARNEEHQEHLWKYTIELLDKYLNDEIKECLEGKRTS